MSSTEKPKSLQEEMEILIAFFKLLKMRSSFFESFSTSYGLIVSSIDIKKSIFSLMISVYTYKELSGFLISWDTVEFMRTVYCLSIFKLSKNIFFDISISYIIFSGSWSTSFYTWSSPKVHFFKDIILRWKKQKDGYSSISFTFILCRVFSCLVL